ncbi:transcription factor TFIIIB component B'' homolog isoform X2 [Cynocephalus volans]|uniref:transcription factor TFIIIB component B'' homolog isoform X2 n=1 Tax=Cynocephalus volans TaxID=110931 RepID=UPI002FC8327D
MFRRARLSVKPNVRPGLGARGSSAPNPQRGQESPRPPEPAVDSAPKPEEPTDVPAVDFRGAEPQEKATRSGDEKTGGENDVEESSKSSATVSQRRKRISSNSSLVKPSVGVASESCPLSAVNQEAPQPNPIPTKEKQPCSDRYRIYKAQKLREMLKKELRKEKKQWKNKYTINESQRPPDRSKMTMRDFIYYLPDNNPMTSSMEQEKKTEKSLTPVQTREQEGKSTPDAEDNEEMEETDDGPLLVPRVKVAEDGSIILDEESLTVEVLRTRGPCVVEENDPIFERGSTTTYSSFRKNYYSKPWSNKETDMFFLAISMVGTDFSMIGQLFPHRARIEIKNKFKREEKTNGWRIDKAFQEKRPFDFDFFAHLLQKVLAEEEKRKQKSIKNHSLKEKKSSKPRKNVKVKKVTSEGVNDDPVESMSTTISDTERSQKDAQTVEEEESLTLLGQDSDQVALEEDLNQKKMRRKNQDEVNEQEVKNLLGNATAQSGRSKGEKHKNKCQSLRPEVNETESSKEQKLSCIQNIDDIVGLASSEKVEKRTDSILSSSNQDTRSVSTESSESSTSDSPSSEVGIRALCEVNNAERSGAEEGNIDLKNKSPETDQTENVKLILRRRLQRPKPNLTRAVGKKSVLSQDTTDAESKNSHLETSVEKNHLEKDKMSTFDIFGMENMERENSKAETVSNLSEKICLQESNQRKTFRTARLIRGQLQRPKPNVGKATERKEILTSQEKIGANVEKNENVSCVDRETPQQMEDWSCKNFEYEDVISQPEEKDTSFQNTQPDESKSLKEYLSIQENSKANILKQVPILRTRFQKLKPNIGRGSGRREISSKEKIPEEILVSGEMEAGSREVLRLDPSPREKVSTETNTIKEIESDLKEMGKRDIFPWEKMPEMIDITVEMETGLKVTEREISPEEKVSKVIDVTEEIDTDLEEMEKREISPQESAPKEVKSIGEMETGLKATGREISPRVNIPEVIDTTEEIDINLEETRRELSPQENAPEEVKSIGEVETDLKATGREISPREKIPEVIDATEEIDTDLEETGRKISPQDSGPEEAKSIGEMETGLKGTGREISPRERILEVIDTIEEIDTDLVETRREIFPQDSGPEEAKSISEMETGLEETGGDISQREKVLVEVNAIWEREIDLKETGERDVSLMEKVSGRITAIEEMEAELKETEKEISLRERGSEEIIVTEEMVVDLKKTGKTDISPRENEPEETGTLRQAETNVMRSSSGDCSATPSLDVQNISSEVLLVMHTSVEEKNSEKEVSSHLSHLKTFSQTSELGRTEDQGMQLPDVPEQFSTTILSRSLQEQKPLEVKSAPFVRSRFKRPKPNLTRATLRRETTEAEKYVPGEKLQTDKMETIVIQQNSEQANNTLPSQHDVASLMTSREKGKSGHKEEEAVILPCTQTEKDRSPSHSCKPKEESQSTQAQENGLVDPLGHEKKPNVHSPAQLTRRKFQKTEPNLGRAHGEKKEPGIEKGTTAQSKASKPEDNLLQQGDSVTQSLLKEKAELLTSLEVTSRKDCVGSQESGFAKKHAQLEEAGPLGSVGEETVGDNPVSSVVEEQYVNKLTSCPQLLKESHYSKSVLDRRTTVFSASECEVDHSERRIHRRIKPSVTKGRGSKRIRGKTSKKEPRASKAILVTLRASQEEDEDDAEDFEPDYDEESYHLPPEELNKAPVFVPIGLRSPEPVSTQIEETMEELEITVNVPDVGCIAVVEQQFSNTDVTTTQEMRKEENLNASSFEITTGEHTQDEPGTNDGSTEAAITLLAMGDLVLQSEISTEQGDGICVLPHVHSEDKSHVPFSPDNVNHKIVHECQELSSPATSTLTASVEVNKVVLEEQSTREEIGLMEKVKENSTPTRDATSKVTNNLNMRSRFAKPKPNLEKTLGTNRFGVHQEVPILCVPEEEVESKGEIEKIASKATELEDKNLGPVTTADSKDQNKLACVHDIKGTSISQEANLTERNENQEEGSQEVQILSVAPIVPSETGSPSFGLGRGLSESSVEEPLTADSKRDSVLTLRVPECTPTSISEVQQENVINTQDLTVNLVANVHQDGEDEQAFILTLVEIPTCAVEGFTDAATQLMPNALLPAPILIKSVNTEEREDDMSMSLPVASVGQDAMCLSNSGRDDSEKPPADLDIISRKRFHCRLDERDHVPPAKKSSLNSRDDCQEYTSKVCSEELTDVFEETGESYKEQSIFPTSGSTHTTPEPQKQQLEPGFQSIGSRSLDKVINTCIEKNMPQLPQDEMVVSDKEERSDAASKSEQMDSRTSSSKTPLSRPGRRPLGFLSLICSKNSLESDEPTQVHSKKRLKPLIPVSRQNLKRSNRLSKSQKKSQESSDVPSPSGVTNTQSENIGSSATQVSCDRPLLKERCKSGQNRAPEEEPATVSEYFFSDIFIEVDETE